MSKIDFADKVALYEQPNINEINKVTDNNINSVKNAINQNGSYTSTIEGTNNGEFYCTLEGTLSIGDIVKVNIANNSYSTNALLSVDGGTTYYPIVNLETNNYISLSLSGSNIEAMFDGTNFVIQQHSYSSTKKAIGIYKDGKTIYEQTIDGTGTASKTSGQAFYKFSDNLILSVDKIINSYGYITIGATDFQLNAINCDDTSGAITSFTRVVRSSGGNARLDYRNTSGTNTSIPYSITIQYTE